MRENHVKIFINKSKEYIEMQKLTPESLRAFIRKIELYKKTEKYSEICGNTIAIRCTFQMPQKCAGNKISTSTENLHTA